jgi:lipid A ethanolaminephosphotransferase
VPSPNEGFAVPRYLKTPEALIFLASIWFVLVCDAGFWRVIAANAPPGGMPGFAYFTSFAGLAVGLTSFILLLLLHGRVTRIALGVFITVAAVTGYFTSKYGVLFDKGMLTNVIETNRAEAFELASLPLVLVIAIVGIVPALAIFRYPLVKRRLRAAVSHRGIALALALCLVAGPLFANQKEVFSVARNHREIQHMLAPLNVISATIMLARDHLEAPQAFRPVARDATHPTAESEHRKPLVHVLIVGETARASSFRLDGYPLDTNPELAEKDGIRFIEAHSCGTATAVSLPCMFSIQEHKDFDREASRAEDNLLDIAARSGYRVYWIDNGNGCKGICARVTHRDVHVSDVDDICPNRECYDEILVNELRQILDTVDEDTFILLHGLGSHGPAYFRRYPEAFRNFKPDCRSPNLGD